MLIDASRGDETRVVVMVDGRIEEIDHETADRRPIKSNIYLARVTRVEPSLQAAFVDYGGNRHGFLPFSEIHPDYYQLPVADREALLAEVEAKVEERRQRFQNRRPSPRRGSSGGAGATSAGTVDPDGDQPHVEFPVDENGDFLQPEPLTAESIEIEEAAVDAEPEVEPTVELSSEAATDASVTDSVASTLGLDETLTEQAVLEEGSVAPTVSLTEAKADDADSGEESDEDDEPAKTVTAATGTEKDDVVVEEAEASADDADETAEDEDDNDDEEDVSQEQVTAEADEADDGEDSSDTASTSSDSEGGIEEVEGEDDVIEEAGSGERVGDDDDDDDEDEDEDEDEEGAAKKPRRRRRRSRRGGRKGDKANAEDQEDDQGTSDVEEMDADDEDEEDEDDIFDEDAERRSAMHSIISRRYKIQEVIKRRQVMLVQVTKEERGNKGAALSSYLSLAGRYCVYMPNTTRGGGISRKISSPKDRRRLKTILDELDLPQDISIIVRTAGSQRTKAEIKRDYEYLRRTWDGIRENTLTSMAPSLIYEEANVMKRAIRDMYSSDMEEVLVEGEDGYKDAKNFMRVLTPSHAKRVKQHKNEGVSLFQSHKAEQQLDALFNPVVTLKSGGYLVMNQTEALVAVDVNSGKATKERSIEETALSTNLEAAEEVARQLRLRDLAGLVVIDFIDMDESKHRGQVERRLKESMRGDRARIQLGRISPFGLLELSRQRIRPSVFETTMVGCSVCGGIGVVRSSGSLASSIMRRIGDLLLERDGLDRIEVDAPTDSALKLLNEHREELANLEARFNVRIAILPNAHLFSPHFHLRVYVDDKVETFSEGYTTDPTAPKRGDRRRGRRSDRSSSRSDDEEENGNSRGGKGRGKGRGRNARSDDDEVRRAEASEADSESAADEETDGEGQSRRQRGKRGGRRRGRKDAEAAAVEPSEDGEEAQAAEGEAADAETETDAEGEKPKRRRGKRGGRNRRKSRGEDEAADAKTETAETGADVGEEVAKSDEAAAEEPTEPVAAEEPAEAEEKPAKKPRRSRKKAKADEEPAKDEASAEAEEPAPAPKAEPEPAPEPEAEAKGEAASAEDADSHVAVEPDTPKKEGPRRRGWWSRGK
ncbi:MAG: Rne/Rng family ribonuclease [Alphaproteobacteria bacterium]